MAQSTETTGKTLGVALILCIVCSVLVSGAAVVLRPLQRKNQRIDKMSNILQAAGLYREGVAVPQQFEQIQTKVIDFATGDYTDAVNPQEFDQRKARVSPQLMVSIPPQEDVGQLKSRSRYGLVYEKYAADGALEVVILPIITKGLWSTMYGFMAIDGGDLNTVKGFAFYEHGETPGLGAEVDNPRWKQMWVGKKIYDESSRQVAVDIVKGTVNPNSEEVIHQVDGLSGATITSNGVEHGLEYWFGPHAYKPYLERLKGRQTAIVSL